MEQKKKNLKISKSLLTIGLVVFVLGIIFICKKNKKRKQGAK